LEKPINTYEVFEIEGNFGLSCYIKIGIVVSEPETKKIETMLFKIDSVRLRNTLKDVSELITEFPTLVKLVKSGYGLNTTYNASLAKKK
jgi:hypothetical protein